MDILDVCSWCVILDTASFPGGKVISREVFGRYVRDALIHFHDTIYLQSSPLLELLRPQLASQEVTTACLRELLRQTIESLRPLPDVPAHQAEWSGYRTLVLRYLRSLNAKAVSDELNVSLATFYRYHQDALEAVIGRLWDAYCREENPTTPQVSPASEPPDARQAAIRLARTSPRQPVELGVVWNKALDIILALAGQRGYALRVHVPATLPTLSGDPALFQQLFLHILTAALDRAAAAVLAISLDIDRLEVCWRVQPLWLDRADSRLAPGELPAEAKMDDADPLAIGQGLVEVYGGRLWFEGNSTDSTTLAFTLPVARSRKVLIVDDDADTIRLYRLFLQAHHYVVRSARTMQELRAAIAESHPDLVLLDVLMPQQDGWDLLNELKGNPQTAAIPVVVCSVLSQPEIALTLGAADVLRKPIQEETLLRTVDRVLARAGKMD